MSQRRKQSTTVQAGRQAPAARRRFLQRAVVSGFVLVVVLVLVVIVVRSSSRAARGQVDRADPANAALVAQGRRLYATRCAGCHGLDLQGEAGWPRRRANGGMPAAPLDERGQAWKHDDTWLFTTIKAGGQATAPSGSINAMPAFGGGLTDAEIWAVISFLKRSWPQHLKDAQPR